jgi:hypothetical protein
MDAARGHTCTLRTGYIDEGLLIQEALSSRDAPMVYSREPSAYGYAKSHLPTGIISMCVENEQ